MSYAEEVLEVENKLDINNIFDAYLIVGVEDNGHLVFKGLCSDLKSALAVAKLKGGFVVQAVEYEDEI